MKYKVGIIVPVYNTEKYLSDCINSILSQTYQNFRLILVNDGSRDSSGDICDSFMEQDERITFIHKENGGLSDARNFGIKNAVGDYLLFLDSDDFLTIEILERPQLPFPAPMDGKDELFSSISKTANRMWAGAVTVPGMSPASGDGEFLRRLGITTYGIGPAMYEQAEGAPHTADEFISEEDYQEQVRFFAGVVYDFALGKNIFPPQETPQTDLENKPETMEEKK